MEYIKKLHWILALGSGLVVGMVFMYKNQPLTNVFAVWLVTIVVFYMIGKFLSGTLEEVENQIEKHKKSRIKNEQKEGNEEILANNVIDIEANDETDESFIELKNLASKE